MCSLKREQARRETQQWVMRRLPTADSIVEIGRKSRSLINMTSYPLSRYSRIYTVFSKSDTLDFFTTWRVGALLKI